MEKGASLDEDAIEITSAVLDALLLHARREAPRECCGLLVGAGSRIDEGAPMTNVEPGTTRFRVDPGEHFTLIHRLRGTGRAILGAYHSHPAAPPVPSDSDLAEAFDAGFVYVIVSLLDGNRPATRAYRIRDGRARAVTLISVR